MSVQILNHVWKHSQQKGNALLTLIAIADQANDDGDCWPGVSKLSNKVRLTERGLQKVIRALEKSGELIVKQRPGQSNIYHIPITGGVNGGSPPNSETGVNGGSPGGERGFTGGGELASSPESSLEPTKEPNDIKTEEQNLAGAQNAPAGAALKADEDGVIVEPESKDAWKNHADILKALATHVNGQLVAVIAAWKDNLLAPPVDGKNPYQNRTIRALALALLSEGYGKSHVERYVKGYYAPGSWWRDKPLSFQQVCERMPAWIAANPDPFEAQRKADEEWERYKASLSSEERAELAAQIEQDDKERG